MVSYEEVNGQMADLAHSIIAEIRATENDEFRKTMLTLALIEVQQLRATGIMFAPVDWLS